MALEASKSSRIDAAVLSCITPRVASECFPPARSLRADKRSDKGLVSLKAVLRATKVLPPTNE
jgi:hypothetical protein